MLLGVQTVSNQTVSNKTVSFEPDDRTCHGTSAKTRCPCELRALLQMGESLISVGVVSVGVVWLLTVWLLTVTLTDCDSAIARCFDASV